MAERETLELDRPIQPKPLGHRGWIRNQGHFKPLPFDLGSGGRPNNVSLMYETEVSAVHRVLKNLLRMTPDCASHCADTAPDSICERRHEPCRVSSVRVVPYQYDTVLFGDWPRADFGGGWNSAPVGHLHASAIKSELPSVEGALDAPSADGATVAEVRSEMGAVRVQYGDRT